MYCLDVSPSSGEPTRACVSIGMGFFKFLEIVSIAEEGRDPGQAPAGSGSPHPHPVLPARRHPLFRVFCAAGPDGLRLLEGHERQPERAAGACAAAGTREGGGGAGEAVPRLTACPRPDRRLHLLTFAVLQG